MGRVEAQAKKVQNMVLAADLASKRDPPRCDDGVVVTVKLRGRDLHTAAEDESQAVV